MAPRLDHIAIMVDDIESTTKYYVEVLGFPSVVWKSLPEIGVRSAFIIAGDGVFIELIEYAGEGELSTGDVVVALEVDDLDETIAALRTAGVRVAEQRETDNIPYRRGWLRKSEGRGTAIELCPKGSVAAFVASSLAASVDDPEERNG